MQQAERGARGSALRYDVQDGLLAKLDKTLSDPLLFAKDPAKAASVSKKRADAARKLEAAEKAWVAASEAYEEANT